MIYFCSQKNRRTLVLQHPTLNGIDFLEVPQIEGRDCGKQLAITMLKDARSLGIGAAQIALSGGTATGQVKVVSVSCGTEDAPKTIAVELDQTGDFSPYSFTLVATAETNEPPTGIDPQLASVGFSFKAGCKTIADCLPCDCCPPAIVTTPDINYLAKDFGGFRQTMLDRMSVLVPDWDQNHVADIGMTLVEMLAYAADHMSYQQDAAGTEGYISTARSRISLRRLVKLVDYTIDPGSNARTWVYLQAAADAVKIKCGTLLYPRVPGFGTVIAPESNQASTLQRSTLGFATMRHAEIYLEQNLINFYTWGDSACCLPTGSTTATLMPQPRTMNFTTLKPGAVLLFEEVMGPDTGELEDANPLNRWAVRLTEVKTTDYLGNPLIDPLNQQAITQITWAAEDALPFPLCISSTTNAANGSRPLNAVSVARGNIVPADHGVWQDWQDLGPVPDPPMPPVSGGSCSCTCEDTDTSPLPRYHPELKNSPLTFAWPLDFQSTANPSTMPPKITTWDSLPASAFLAPISSSATRPAPQILVEDNVNQSWIPLDDLLSSDETTRAYVLEVEHDGSAFLRFGDGQYGMAPVTGMEFQAKYRVGNGAIGNIGRDTLAHLLPVEAGALPGVVLIRNPLAATGGVDQETMQHITRSAPYAFRTQLRAVTEADYSVMAEQDPAIQEAKGTFRWTGSWYTAFVSLDSVAQNGPSPALIGSTTTRLNLLRMIGTDLDVQGAVLVGLRITLSICVDVEYVQADVRSAVMQLFVMGNMCNGQPGLLDPANFTFGEAIYTSPFIAAAQGVEGVDSVTITAFQRMDDASDDGVAKGYLQMGTLELARCNNDPNRLDLGVLTINADGGK